MLRTSSITVKNFFKDASNKHIIDNERKGLLLKIANYIANEYEKEQRINLNFICTHNSRRSQFAQVWGFYAAEYFDMNIHSYSGGTEVTAFYRNTVKSLQRVGFDFQVVDFSHQNPKYEISFAGNTKSILGFSKLYDDIINPDNFIAITTCNNADKNCPYIPTATQRFHLPFVDPKHADGKKEQDEVYLKTSKQIAAELFFIFKEVKKILL